MGNVEYIWEAVENGKLKRELEKEGYNKFSNLNKSLVDSFGIRGISNNNSVTLNTKNGLFNINGLEFIFNYVSNEKIYNLAFNGECKDIIYFKQSSMFIGGDSKISGSSFINSYNVGFKKSITFNDVLLHYQILFVIPKEESPYFEVKLTSSKDIDGYFEAVMIGRGNERIDYKIKKNRRTTFRWVAH